MVAQAGDPFSISQSLNEESEGFLEGFREGTEQSSAHCSTFSLLSATKVSGHDRPDFTL